MTIEAILGLLGGSLGVFLLKLYGDWRNNKRSDKNDVVGAWQQIANRETENLTKLETHVREYEKIVIERDYYIKQLEQLALSAGLSLPVRTITPLPGKGDAKPDASDAGASDGRFPSP